MKTIRQEKHGTASLRLVERADDFVGLVISGGKTLAQITGTDSAAVWSQLLDQARAASPEYFGYQGARARFLAHFSDGFASQAFDEHERAYKVKAKALLDQTLPLAAALDGMSLGAAALKIYQATNLLSVFEKTRLGALLRSDKADAFVRAAALFASGDHAGALAAMERLAAPYDCAKWTVITYLPFLWDPDTSMFLKPAVTQDYARRVGHAFADTYTADLDVAVYHSLLDLAAETRGHVADLDPRNNIDIQSFIWIVGAYQADDGAEPDPG